MTTSTDPGITAWPKQVLATRKLFLSRPLSHAPIVDNPR